MAETEIKEMGNFADKETWLAKVVNRLNMILEEYLSRYPRYHELKEFMKDESNLYDEDRSIKPEYQKWIDDVESFTADHPIKDILREMHKDDPLWEDIYEGIEKYIRTNEELRLSYEKAQKEEGKFFDVEEWIYNQIQKSSEDDKEADEKFSSLAKMISEETLATLEGSSELRIRLKEEIDNYGKE